MLLIVVPPGLSALQVAQRDMAREKGVRVIELDCTAIKGECYDYHYAEMASIAALRDQAAAVLSGALTLPVPPTREQLEGRCGLGRPVAVAAVQDDASTDETASTTGAADAICSNPAATPAEPAPTTDAAPPAAAQEVQVEPDFDA